MRIIKSRGDGMQGIKLDRPITYVYSSLRAFEEGEHHITRICDEKVLLIVYEGVLRFSEDGVQKEVSAGEYYIQRDGILQGGEIASDSPKYLYVHFYSDWSDADEDVLPFFGKFESTYLAPLTEELGKLSIGNYTYTEKCAVFFSILTALYRANRELSTPELIAEYISAECFSGLTLDDICKKFNFSRNYIINLFKKEYGITPFEYMNSIKIKRAMYLLKTTSSSIENIAYESGYNNYSHFYRLFRRHTGMAPLEWRNTSMSRHQYKMFD